MRLFPFLQRWRWTISRLIILLFLSFSLCLCQGVIHASSVPGLNEVSEILPIGDSVSSSSSSSTQRKVTWHSSLSAIREAKEQVQGSSLSGPTLGRSSSSPMLSSVHVSKKNPAQKENSRVFVYLDSDRKALQNCVRLSIRGIGCRAPATIVEVPLTSSTKDVKVGRRGSAYVCVWSTSILKA